MNKLNVDLTPKIKRLFITTPYPSVSTISGERRSIYQGRGAEFDTYKDYRPGSDAKRIDWKASLKANKLLVKEFVEERKLNVFFLMDISKSMFFGSSKRLKNEYALELLNSLAIGIINAGDNVGFGFFNNKIVNRLPITNQRNKVRKSLERMRDPNLYKGKFDLSKPLKFIIPYLEKNNLLIIISDFIGVNEKGWEDRFGVAGKKFDLLSIIIRDPRDEKLPSGSGEVFISDPYSNRKLLLEPKMIKDEYEQYVKQEDKKLKQVFIQNQCDFIKIFTNQSFVTPILEFFQRRSKWR